MYDADLRLAKRWAFRPLTIRLAAASPMKITLLGLVAGLLAALSAAQGKIAIAALLWLLNRLLDGLDGELARFRETQSDLGGYIDLLADLVVYALVPIGLAWSRLEPPVLIALAFMLAAFYVNAGTWMLLSALLEKRRQAAADDRTSFTMPVGLIEGAETVVLFTLFFLFPQHLALLFGVTAALVGLTAAQRAASAARALQAAALHP
jgi:phosphatidylserine synthase